MFTYYKQQLETLKEAKFSLFILSIREKVLKTIQSNYLSSRTRAFFQDPVPFNDFGCQPRQIKQIKEIVNALYFIETALRDLESLEISNIYTLSAELKKIYQKTVGHLYDAAYLITHLNLDSNLSEVFRQEFSALSAVFLLVKNYVVDYQKDTLKIGKLIEGQSITHLAGRMVGVLINQMQPDSHKVDYNFLTHFGALLPEYIQKLTAKIQQYSTNIAKYEPALDKAQIEALEVDATMLLQAIDSLQDNDAIMVIKLLVYVRIIRHIMTLTGTIIKQMDHLSDKSQDLIRDKLSQLKYELLPKILTLTDRVEDQGLLTPGTLSVPLMRYITPMYQQLIECASKPVNFSTRRQDLLILEDVTFIELRVMGCQQRINEANQGLFKIEHVQKSFQNFFQILEKPQYRNRAFFDLPDVTRKVLARHYKSFQHHVENKDVFLHNRLVLSLLTNKRYLIKISEIQACKPHWHQQIESEKATFSFHIALNNDIIDKIYESANLSLQPRDPEFNPLKFDELKILNIDAESAQNLGVIFHDENKNTSITHTEKLNSCQALKLFTFYGENRSKIRRALHAFEGFTGYLIDHSLSIYRMDNERKEQLRNLYLIFQPYFISILSDDKWIEIFDITLIKNLKEIDLDNKPLFEIFPTHFMKPEVIDKYKISMQNALNYATNKIKAYEKISQDLHMQEIQNQILPIEKSGCASYALYLDPVKLNPLQLSHLSGNRDALVFYNDVFYFFNNKLHKISEIEKTEKNSDTFDKLKDKLFHKNINASRDVIELLKKIFNSLHISDCMLFHTNEDPEEKPLHQWPKQLTHQNSLILFKSTLYFYYEPEKNLTKILDEPETSETVAKLKDRFSIEYKKTNGEHLKLISDLTGQTHFNREHYVLKHRDYSKAIRSFNRILLKMTSQFNFAVQRQLKPVKNNVPFPEIELYPRQLPVRNPVLLMKRLYNSLYHLEHIFIKIEQLKNNSFQYKYIYQIFVTWSHIYQLNNLFYEFKDDKYLKFLRAKWQDKFQEIFTLFQNESSMYLKAPPPSEDGMIQYPGLWYILQFLELIPSHLNALTTQTDLSDIQLINLREKCKEKQLGIEKIILSSDSSFLLLMRTPVMYELFTGLKKNLDRFTTLCHASALTHLKEIYTVWIANILLEADVWEDRLALKPGLISDPLNELLYTFYLALVEALKLQSDRHLECVSDISLYEKRLLANEMRFCQAGLKLNFLNFKLDKINVFLDSYNTMNNIIPAQKIMELIRLQVDNAMQEALPILLDEKNNLSLNINASCQNIKEAIEAAEKVKMFYDLKVATLELTKDTALFKKVHLENLLLSKLRDNKQYLKNYINQTFENTIDFIIHEQKEFHRNINLEYKKKLKQFLKHCQKNTSKLAASQSDIVLFIRNVLQEKAEEFHEVNCLKYRQLNQIMLAITRFLLYTDTIDETASLFEDRDTLNEKRRQLNLLADIVENQDIEIEERLRMLKRNVSHPSFTVPILAHKKQSDLSFATLQRFCLKVLDTVHLQTNESQKYYKNLYNAAESPVFFAPQPSAPQPSENAPNMNN